MKILLADDHALFLEGFVLLLSQHFPDAECLISNSYDGLCDLLKAHNDIDLALVDWNMPGMQGIKSIQHLQTHHLLPICIISADESPAQIDLVLKTGISGYIPKSLSSDLMHTAITMMLEGNVFAPPLHKPFTYEGDDRRALAKTLAESVLTKRQCEILALLATGLSDKCISIELGITAYTLRSHLKQIFARLNVNNRTEAAVKARELQFQ